MNRRTGRAARNEAARAEMIGLLDDFGWYPHIINLPVAVADVRNGEIRAWCDEQFGPQLWRDIEPLEAHWMMADLTGYMDPISYAFRTPEMAVAFRLRWT